MFLEALRRIRHAGAVLGSEEFGRFLRAGYETWAPPVCDSGTTPD
jgi:hypothetical protein